MTTAVLADRVIRFIGDPAAEDFDHLALEVFEHQFARNQPYQEYCRSLGVIPGNVFTWRDVPVVSTDAFKEQDLYCGPPQATFLTTGTTQGRERRGRHFVPRLDVYRASALRNFAQHVAPEGGDFHVFVLAPSLAHAPQSSLAQMIEWIAAEFGSSVGYYLEGGRLMADRLRRDLVERSAAGEPALVLALTRALVELAEVWGWPDRAALSRKKVTLPALSRVMDTGGSKGLDRDVGRDEMFAMAEALFGIDPKHVINEYGMTEMCSQFYDDALANPRPKMTSVRCKAVPHWVRTLVVDPLTLGEMESGASGLLQHFDLANVESVSAILTEDIGHRVGTGFEIEGRVAGAGARGCSLVMDER